MKSVMLQVVSFAGLLSAIAAFLYGIYCLVRTVGAGMRIAARLDALWLVPLGLLGLDRLLQSEARRTLKDNVRHWMWRSVMAAALSAAGLVVWAAANPPVQWACSNATIKPPISGCASVAKVISDPLAKR